LGCRVAPAREELGPVPQHAIAGDWRAFDRLNEFSGPRVYYCYTASADSNSASPWRNGPISLRGLKVVTNGFGGEHCRPRNQFSPDYSVAGISAVSSSVSPS
jgi:hypothetical protein